MSSQTQPVQVYPNTVTTRQPSSHSNGSFGTVFIVLAVIVAVSAIACFFGRFCNRKSHDQHSHRRNNHHHNQDQPEANKNHSHGLRGKEGGETTRPNFQFQPRERDIEFGFDRRIPNGRVAAGDGDSGAGAGGGVRS